MFLREDAIRKPLVPPYSGPHRVVKRSEKNFVILLRDKEVVVSIDRVKPAYLLAEESTTSGKTDLQPSPEDFAQAKPTQTSQTEPTEIPGYRTRTGRLVKKNVKFCDSVTEGGVV